MVFGQVEGLHACRMRISNLNPLSRDQVNSKYYYLKPTEKFHPGVCVLYVCLTMSACRGQLEREYGMPHQSRPG